MDLQSISNNFVNESKGDQIAVGNTLSEIEYTIEENKRNIEALCSLISDREKQIQLLNDKAKNCASSFSYNELEDRLSSIEQRSQSSLSKIVENGSSSSEIDEQSEEFSCTEGSTEKSEHFMEDSASSFEEGSELLDKKRPQFFDSDNLGEVLDYLNVYYERTNTKFATIKKSKNFSSKERLLDLHGHHIYYHHKESYDGALEFDGIPFVTTGSFFLMCEFGKYIARNRPRKSRENGQKQRVRASKKQGCPAFITVKKYVKFPQFKIAAPTKSRKRRAGEKLKEKMLQNSDQVEMETHFLVRLPALTEHQFHSIEKDEGLHPAVSLTIKELLLENISIAKIITIIEKKKDEIVPNMDDKYRFTPSPRDVREISKKLVQINQFSETEEIAFQHYIREKENKDQNVHYEVFEDIDLVIEGDTHLNQPENKKSKLSEEKNHKLLKDFIYCYQSKQQQLLLQRYNNGVTYFTKIKSDNFFPFSLYLLAVQTNVDYQVVGCFLVSKNFENGVKIALDKFTKWNKFWNAKYIFTDYEAEMVDAIQNVFKDSEYLFNFDSCCAAWEEYLSNPVVGLNGYKTEIIEYMTNMAQASNTNKLSEAAAAFENSAVWTESNELREWFQHNWMENAKKWVKGYRDDDVVQMSHFKTSFGACEVPYRDFLNEVTYSLGLSAVIKNISDEIPQLHFQRYINRNVTLNQHTRNLTAENDAANFCYNSPVLFVPILSFLKKVVEKTKFKISQDKSGIFAVSVIKNAHITFPLLEEPTTEEAEVSEVDNENQSEEPVLVKCNVRNIFQLTFKLFNDGAMFVVSFGDHNSFPFCTCSYWIYYRIPCLHMVAIFHNVTGWNFNMLSPLYRSNNMFQIDHTVLPSDKIVADDTCLKSQQNELENPSDNNGVISKETNFLLPVIPPQHESFDSISQLNKLNTCLQSCAYLFQDQDAFAKLTKEVTELSCKCAESLKKRGATASANQNHLDEELSRRQKSVETPRYNLVNSKQNISSVINIASTNRVHSNDLIIMNPMEKSKPFEKKVIFPTNSFPSPFVKTVTVKRILHNSPLGKSVVNLSCSGENYCSTENLVEKIVTNIPFSEVIAVPTSLSGIIKEKSKYPVEANSSIKQGHFIPATQFLPTITKQNTLTSKNVVGEVFSEIEELLCKDVDNPMQIVHS